MVKATGKTETAVEAPATEVAAGNVRLTALRTFLDSTNGNMVGEGTVYETTEQRARELAQMGCLSPDA